MLIAEKIWAHQRNLQQIDQNQLNQTKIDQTKEKEGVKMALRRHHRSISPTLCQQISVRYHT